MAITNPAYPDGECVHCGSTQGPDREARWECGETDLDTWDQCPVCRAPLCDSCSLSANHTCEEMIV